ncbi:MAG: hypothetical protein ACI9XC_000531 [Gammaproteobacteria bacterium]|jgi:hypothetical protein
MSFHRFFISIISLLFSFIVATLSFAQNNQNYEDELRAEANKRNKNYAPWSPDDITKLREGTGLIGPGPRTSIPEATFPGYLKRPTTVAELMPQALAAVTQKGGRSPLGLADPGDIVLIVIPHDSDRLIQEAIVQAYKSRKIEARIIYKDEILGISSDLLNAIAEAKNVFKAGDGQQESGEWFELLGNWPDFNIYKNWVTLEDPVYASATWPDFDFPDDKMATLDKNFNDMVFAAIIKYLDEHPEVNRVYYQKASRTLAKSALKHHGNIYMGNYTYLNHYDLMGQSPNVPADVWRMLEGKMIDPLSFVDRYEISDPEGTAMHSDVTVEEARIWAAGSYQQGHLYMIPSQSSGRYPYSRVNYPAVGNNWLDSVQSRTNGIIASTNSHASNHARIEVHLKDGYMDKIIGGGLYGDGMRLSLAYPKINELIWPDNPKPGFWWLYEAGTGTNPKYFKHPKEILLGQNLSERNAGGVIHWSFGTTVSSERDTDNFREKNQMPTGHAMHHHTLLPTYQVRLRDSGNWLTLIEHGVIQTYVDPEVRALTSRYGNPDDILRRDWIPELPGITIPGNYNEDYASDPGTHWVKWANSIEDGSNKYIGN